MCGCGYGCGCRCRWVWLCTMGVRVGVRMCVGCGVGGCGCVVVIVFLLETGYEPQQKGDCRFTYVCQTLARATHLSDSLCLSDYVFWLIFLTFGIKMKTMKTTKGFRCRSKHSTRTRIEARKRTFKPGGVLIGSRIPHFCTTSLERPACR